MRFCAALSHPAPPLKENRPTSIVQIHHHQRGFKCQTLSSDHHKLQPLWFSRPIDKTLGSSRSHRRSCSAGGKLPARGFLELEWNLFFFFFLLQMQWRQRQMTSPLLVCVWSSHSCEETTQSWRAVDADREPHVHREAHKPTAWWSSGPPFLFSFLFEAAWELELLTSCRRRGCMKPESNCLWQMSLNFHLKDEFKAGARVTTVVPPVRNKVNADKCDKSLTK